MLKRILMKIIAYTLFILFLGIIIGLFITWGDLGRTLQNIESYTVLSSLLIVLGKLMGSLSPAVNVGSRTIASPSLGDKVDGVWEKGWEELFSGWGALLAGIALAVIIGYLIEVATM